MRAVSRAPRRPRAVGFIRVPYLAGEPSEPLQVQEAELWKGAFRRDLDLIEIILEIGVFEGAPLDERYGPQDAVDAIRSGRASVVLVLSSEGVTRTEAEGKEFQRRIERAGGSLLSLRRG